jgi:hypothetical protein
MYSDESTRTYDTKTGSDRDFYSGNYDKRLYNKVIKYEDEEDYETLIDPQMISRYEKREDYDDNIESGIVYYYIVKCWNPFKYCYFTRENQQCMNIVCKSLFIILLIMFVSAIIIFSFQYMKYV